MRSLQSIVHDLDGATPRGAPAGAELLGDDGALVRRVGVRGHIDRKALPAFLGHLGHIGGGVVLKDADLGAFAVARAVVVGLVEVDGEVAVCGGGVGWGFYIAGGEGR